MAAVNYFSFSTLFFRMRDVFLQTKRTSKDCRQTKQINFTNQVSYSRKKLLGQQGKLQEINGTH